MIKCFMHTNSSDGLQKINKIIPSFCYFSHQPSIYFHTLARESGHAPMELLIEMMQSGAF